MVRRWINIYTTAGLIERFMLPPCLLEKKVDIHDFGKHQTPHISEDKMIKHLYCGRMPLFI